MDRNSDEVLKLVKAYLRGALSVEVYSDYSQAYRQALADVQAAIERYEKMVEDVPANKS